MKKIILTLLLAIPSLSFADIYKDACDDFDKERARNKSLNILEYAENLSKRANQARNSNKAAEADRLLKLFTVTVSTGLRFGINSNPTPELVERLVIAVKSAYNFVSKKGVSSQDLAKPFNDMDEIYDLACKKEDTLNQYAAVVEYSYRAVGLHEIKPWADVPNIDQIKTKKPSEIFIPSVFEKKDEKPKPLPASPKPYAPSKPDVKPAPTPSKASASPKLAPTKTTLSEETTYRPLKYLKLVEQEKRGSMGQVTNEDDIENYKKLQDAFNKGQYPYKNLEEDLQAVKGLQEIDIDSLMGDEVINELITFYQEKQKYSEKLKEHINLKSIRGAEEAAERLKKELDAGTGFKNSVKNLKFPDTIRYLRNKGSSNFNKGVEALLKAINYKGNISEENEYNLGKWILGNKVFKLKIAHTTDENLKKVLTNVFQGQMSGERYSKTELASILFKEGILAVPKINMSTRTTFLLVDIGNHFDLKEHGENDVYLEFDDGKIGRLTTGNHFYSSVGLKLSLQEQTALEEVKKSPAGH